MISSMQILCKVDYSREILAEDFQFVVEEETLNKDYRGLKYLFYKDVFSDYDQSRNIVEHLLEDVSLQRRKLKVKCL